MISHCLHHALLHCTQHSSFFMSQDSLQERKRGGKNAILTQRFAKTMITWAQSHGGEKLGQVSSDKGYDVIIYRSLSLPLFHLTSQQPTHLTHNLASLLSCVIRVWICCLLQ